MVKKILKKNNEEKVECKDRLCPIHGDKRLKLHGRVFEGVVINKIHGRVKIEFERILKVPKYERYEKRRTRIHARLPDCLNKEVQEGDLIQIEETRPISKTINFIVAKVIRKKEEKI
jgi:small subunit ribosomal protein S17